MKRFLQKAVETRVARALIKQAPVDGTEFRVDLKDGELILKKGKEVIGV